MNLDIWDDLHLSDDVAFHTFFGYWCYKTDNRDRYLIKILLKMSLMSTVP